MRWLYPVPVGIDESRSTQRFFLFDGSTLCLKACISLKHNRDMRNAWRFDGEFKRGRNEVLTLSILIVRPTFEAAEEVAKKKLAGADKITSASVPCGSCAPPHLDPSHPQTLDQTKPLLMNPYFVNRLQQSSRRAHGKREIFGMVDER